MFVTRKLTVSVGEVVNGGPLPPTPRHTPVCSFNSQNKYVGESLAAELPASAQRASSEAAGERAAASGGFSGAGARVSARVRVCASTQRPAVALRPARRGLPAPRCLFPRRAHAPRPAVGSPWGRRLSPVPLYSLPCRRGPRRRVQCRGGRAPAGPPPTACAGACRPASAPGPGSGRPGRRARPLPAPRAAPRAAGAASCSAGARVLRRGEVCRPASEGHVACGVPVSAERATKGVCVCPGTFRASCGGSQSGTWPAGSACVSDEELEAPRAGTTRGSLARRHVSLKRRSRNSGGRAEGFYGPGAVGEASAALRQALPVQPCPCPCPCRPSAPLCPHDTLFEAGDVSTRDVGSAGSTTCPLSRACPPRGSRDAVSLLTAWPGTGHSRSQGPQEHCGGR